MEVSLHLEKKQSMSKTSALKRGVYWIAFLRSFSVQLEYSRIVQYVYNVFQFILSFGLMYSDPQVWVVLSIALLSPYLIVVNIGVVIYVGKKFEIQDSDLALLGIRFDNPVDFAVDKGADKREEEEQRY